jgi:hypothetical protein
MTAFTVTIETWTDADYAQAFRYQLGTAIPPVYYDFTGCSLRMMIRKNAPDNQVFLDLNSSAGLLVTESGIDIYDPEDQETAGLWEFAVIILRAELQRIPQGTYEHSLIIKTPDGLYQDLWRGNFINTIGPTR